MTLTRLQRNLLIGAGLAALVLISVLLTMLAMSGGGAARQTSLIGLNAAEPVVDPVALAKAALEDCDRLAAHPQDPNRLSAGVPDDALAAGAAVTSCEEAVLLNPNSVTTRFNYGRALYAAQRDPDAMVELAAVSEAGYAPALMLIGDAFIAGRAVPGEGANFAAALQYYEQAGTLGHTPALAAVDETREIIARNTFVADRFQDPGFMRRLYEGRISDVEYPISLLAYMRGVVESLDSTEAIYLDQSCKPMISKLGVNVVEFGQSVAYLEQIATTLSAGNESDFWTGVARGLGQHITVEYARDRGYRDGIVLFDEDVYGCDSAVTEQVVRNIMITARRQ